MIDTLNFLIDLLWIPFFVLMIVLVLAGYDEPERRRKWHGA
jgi:hypothetical protein